MSDPAASAPQRLEAGLYLAATPIGAAEDVTLRALDLLDRADAIAAEDTRRARQLMTIHGIGLRGRPMIAYHDRNGAARRPGLLKLIAEGGSVVYVSDAGTPLIADPGYPLARAAIAAGHAVRAAPGASALLAALSVSGLPTDRFFFAGFPPTKAAALARWLDELRAVPGTLVFYESPRRAAATLSAMAAALGGARDAAICRELTKKFEETRRAPLAELAAAIAEGPDLRGEIVLLVGPAPERPAAPEDVDAALAEALTRLSVKDASAEVARATGAPKRDIYNRALALQREAE